MKTKTLAIILFTFTTFVIKGNESKKLFRWPAISPNGNTIAFSYQGDIWKVSAQGGEAIRLTVHNGYEYAPRFSPDGTQIAFSGNRFGNDDIFTIPLKGGTVKRVTYHSARDVLCDWSESGKLIFETSREFRQPEWDYEIYSAPANGGTPSRFLNAVGYMATESPNGRFVAFVRGACRIARESYKGPANKDIWLYDSKHDKYIKLTTYEGNDFYPQWADNKNIYFISSRNGRYNIFKIIIDTDGNVAHPPTAITHYSDDGIRYFNLSTSGKYMVFERLCIFRKHTQVVNYYGKVVLFFLYSFYFRNGINCSVLIQTAAQSINGIGGKYYYTATVQNLNNLSNMLWGRIFGIYF
jgi:Tol biopolymer transport system component